MGGSAASARSACVGAVVLLVAIAASGLAAPSAEGAGGPNVLVIETDDQTVESMRVMDNVNSLIGDQGATFKNSFVNFSLCCPSRSTFLTGQYAHNHGVLGNAARRRLRPLRVPARDNNLAVWLQNAGYYTAMIGKYLNGTRTIRPSTGLVGMVRGRARAPGRLRLHAERERDAGPLRTPTRPTSSRTC